VRLPVITVSVWPARYKRQNIWGMQMLGRLLKNEYFVSISNKISLAVISMLTSVVLNRYLGSAIKGEYVSLIAITGIASTVLDLGIYQAYPYYKKNMGAPMLDSFANLIFIQFVLYSAAAAVAAVFTGNIVYSFVILLIPTSVYSLQLNNMILTVDIKYRSRANTISSLFNLGIITVLFVFLRRCDNVLIPLAVLFGKQLVIIGLMLRRIPLRFRVKEVDRSLVRQVLKFGFYPMLTLLLLTLNYKTGVLILKYLNVPKAGIGIFSTGVALSEYMWIIPDGFKDVMYNKTAKGNPIEELLLVLKAALLVGILSVAGISLFGRQIIILLYGVEFAPAYKVTIVLFAGVISMMYFKIIGTLFLSNGKREIYFYTLLASVTLNIVLNFALIPRFEIMGAAVSTAVSYTVMGAVFVFRFSRMYHIKLFRMFVMNKRDAMAITGRFKSILKGSRAM